MSKPSQPSVSPVSRRTLFAGAGTAGALAAAEPALEGGEDGRYRATAHVMRYYQTAKV